MDGDEDGDVIADTDVLANLREGDSYWCGVSIERLRDALCELQRAGVLRYSTDGMIGTRLLADAPPYAEE